MAKAKKKAIVKAHRMGYMGHAGGGRRDSWWAIAICGYQHVAVSYFQPTRKRAIAMVKAALEAGGYEVES